MVQYHTTFGVMDYSKPKRMVGDVAVKKEIRNESKILFRKQENTPNRSHRFITTISAAGKTDL